MERNYVTVTLCIQSECRHTQQTSKLSRLGRLGVGVATSLLTDRSMHRYGVRQSVSPSVCFSGLFTHRLTA